MAEKKQSIEEAVLDLQKIQKLLNANTKEILRSVAREEIDGLVKESLEEDDYEEETIDDKSADAETSEEDSLEDEGDSLEGEEASLEDEEDEDDSEGDIEIGGEESDELNVQTPDEVGDEDDQDLGMDADAFDGDEIDMVNSSDDDVFAIYKKLSGDDEIEIVGDEIHLNISEPGEYIVKKGALGMEDEMGVESDLDEDYEDEGLTYEIEMGDEAITEDSEEENVVAENSEEEEEEEEASLEEEEEEEATKDESLNEGAKEVIAKLVDKGILMSLLEPILLKFGVEQSKIDAITDELRGVNSSIRRRTTGDIDETDDVMQEAIPVGLAQSKRLPGKVDIGQPRGAGAKGLEESYVPKSIVSEAEVKYKKLIAEASQLKTENEEFRQALKKFRGMLVETVVFNSNLSYVTKLFIEHSTTKDEKKKIIQRFDDEVTNLKESKRLYKTIVNELSARKPINEAVENKIIKEVTTSSSKQLNEATAYVDPSTQRIKDLIKRVENR